MFEFYFHEFVSAPFQICSRKKKVSSARDFNPNLLPTVWQSFTISKVQKNNHIVKPKVAKWTVHCHRYQQALVKFQLTLSPWWGFSRSSRDLHLRCQRMLPRQIPILLSQHSWGFHGLSLLQMAIYRSTWWKIIRICINTRSLYPNSCMHGHLFTHYIHVLSNLYIHITGQVCSYAFGTKYTKASKTNTVKEKLKACPQDASIFKWAFFVLFTLLIQMSIAILYQTVHL